MLIYASQPTNFGRTRFSNIPICEHEVVLVVDGKRKKESRRDLREEKKKIRSRTMKHATRFFSRD